MDIEKIDVKCNLENELLVKGLYKTMAMNRYISVPNYYSDSPLQSDNNYCLLIRVAILNFQSSLMPNKKR